MGLLPLDWSDEKIWISSWEPYGSRGLCLRLERGICATLIPMSALSQHFHLVFITPGQPRKTRYEAQLLLPHILVISRKRPKRSPPAGCDGMCSVNSRLLRLIFVKEFKLPPDSPNFTSNNRTRDGAISSSRCAWFHC